MVNEEPILFSAEMIRAILDGRKTQTRRIVKTKFDWELKSYLGLEYGHLHNFKADTACGLFDAQIACPYGAIGDDLWVRETHYRIPHFEPPCTRVYYTATDTLPTISELHDMGMYKKYSSIYMPRWASRIQLKKTGIRVERVQDITVEDALAEGIDHNPMNEPRVEFQWLWESINGKNPLKCWDANPLVWVIEFEVKK